MRPVKCIITIMCLLLFSGALGANIDFTNWHTPAQMETELENLAAAHPNIAKIVEIGTSWNGNPIKALKISDWVNVDASAEGDVVFVGLHHAREWISAEMCLYFAEYLLNAYGSDAEITQCINNLEIWIIPVLNPDGYQYSATTERLWRKNRRNNGNGTFGVDLNRNYSYQWGLGTGNEGSDFKFHDCYRGPSAFSEPETIAFRDFVNSLDHPKAILTYHSYSELFLRPWAYTTAAPPGEKTLKYIVDDSISRIAAVHGHTYGSSIWYVCYGETGDYFWSNKRIATFTPELRPTLYGIGGFDPPPSQIIPNNQENLPAAVALLRDAALRKVWIKDHPADTGQEPSSQIIGGHWTPAFWVSPDIWTYPAELTAGSTVTLKVRVHNDTGSTMQGCTIAAYYTDPRVILEFPALGSVLIDEQTHDLPPGDTVIEMPWTVPTDPNIWGEWHWCVGAIVYHPNDRPLTTQIQRSSNVACRNFQTVPVQYLQYQIHLPVAIKNFLNTPAEFRLTVDKLPKGWTIKIPEPHGKVSRKAKLLDIKGNVLKPGELAQQRLLLKIPKNVKAGTVKNVNVHAVLLPLVAGRRTPVGNGYTFRIKIPKK